MSTYYINILNNASIIQILLEKNPDVILLKTIVCAENIIWIILIT